MRTTRVTGAGGPERGSVLRRAAAIAIVSAAVPVPASAQQPAPAPATPAFRYERPVVPGGAGPNRLAPDVSLLARAMPFRVVRRSGGTLVAEGGLRDLRLYDSRDREVPHLLVGPALTEPVWRDGTVLPVAETKETSGFETDLGGALLIDRIRVNGLPAPFLKRVLRLEGSGDRARWTVLVSEGTLFDLPDEGLRQVELAFDPGEYRYLRVTWDDRTSGRVPRPSSVSARPLSAATAATPIRADVTFERRASEPGKSRYRLRLPASKLPVVAIELAVSGGNVLRSASISEARLAGDQVAPAVLGTSLLKRAVRGDMAASSLRIPIEQPTEGQLELTVDDGDNPPLSLTSVTAVLAALPFIYFESADGAPLVARFGNDNLSAPRYDLEAVRDSVSSMRLANARWGDRYNRAPVAAASTASPFPIAGAPVDRATFPYSRTISTGLSGLLALRLDVPALAHSRFTDLRIADAQGRQIPYLLERLDEPLTLTVAAVATRDRPAASVPSGPGVRTHYRVRLPFATLPASRLVLATPARVFQRRVSVEVDRRPADSRREPYTDRVADVVWSHADPESPAPALTVPLPALGSTEAYLVVDEGDNSPLPLEAPTLLLPAYRLRFFRNDGSELTLLYGRSDLSSPRYDLALLAPRLVGAAAQEINPGPERISAVAAASRVPTLIFWGVLVGAVLVLLLIIGRLVRQGDAGASPSPSAP